VTCATVILQCATALLGLLVFKVCVDCGICLWCSQDAENLRNNCL